MQTPDASAMPPVMVLAAGLGTRMRPITDTLPKPLIKIGGETMLDRVLDTFGRAGIDRAVVNTHYLPDQIEAHCGARIRSGKGPSIILSREAGEPLETGGGIVRALPHLDNVFFTTNSDSFWVGDTHALPSMLSVFNPLEMDLLLLLAPRHSSIGLGSHPGDFAILDDGTLARRGHYPVPFNYTGTALMTAEIFANAPEGPFSLNVLFDWAIERRRLYGYILRGQWMTVGTPAAIATAEAALDRVQAF
ncbi:MAG: nucleotidyltransferase family protein [Cohaesibacteraceae bacterium]